MMQIVAWIFAASSRRARLRSLGRRACHYETKREKVLPVGWQQTFHSQSPNRQLPPRAWLYAGWAPRAIRVAADPGVEIDLSTRPIDGKNMWETIELLAQAYDRENGGDGQGDMRRTAAMPAGETGNPAAAFPVLLHGPPPGRHEGPDFRGDTARKARSSLRTQAWLTESPLPPIRCLHSWS